MIVTRLALTDFLSYKNASAEFGEGLNIITGENASGKTNLIDALHYCSLGRTSRQSRDKELINWESKNGARVTLYIKKKYSKHVIDIYIDDAGKKRILVDGLPLKKIGELMGILNVVFFAPDEMKLVKESPADRRRFMDISLCQQSKTYFYALSRFNSLLIQRNKLLKTNKGRPSLNEMLPIIDREFVKSNAFIISERAKFVERLKPLVSSAHKKLSSEKEEMRLVYETEDVDFADIENSFAALLKNAYAADTKYDYTTVGAHRDDLKISLNGVDIRKYGSQGQQRSAVLSLKLAEIMLFTERTGEAPVLLLDDVLSELDYGRRTALMSALEDVQTFVTCTEYEDEDRECKKFIIKNRVLEEKNG